MTVEMERSGQEMCNLSEAVWMEGREQGREQGRLGAITDAVQKLVKKMGMTAEQAMDILEVEEKDREEVLQHS